MWLISIFWIILLRFSCGYQILVLPWFGVALNRIEWLGFMAFTWCQCQNYWAVYLLCPARCVGLRGDLHLPGLCHPRPAELLWPSITPSQTGQCCRSMAVPFSCWCTPNLGGWAYFDYNPLIKIVIYSWWLKLLYLVCFQLVSRPTTTYLEFFISFYLLILAGEGITLLTGCKWDDFEVKKQTS